MKNWKLWRVFKETGAGILRQYPASLECNSPEDESSDRKKPGTGNHMLNLKGGRRKKQPKKVCQQRGPLDLTIHGLATNMTRMHVLQLYSLYAYFIRLYPCFLISAREE